MTRRARTVAHRILGDSARGRVRIGNDRIDQLTSPERHQVQDLVLSVRRHVFLLDAILRRFLKGSMQSIPGPVRDALRLGIYEVVVRERSRIPVVVSETVELVGRNPRVRGLINAILRRVADGFLVVPHSDALDRHVACLGPTRTVRFHQPILPDPSQLVQHYSVLYTLTTWFVERVLESWPLEARAFFEACRARRPLTLRPTKSQERTAFERDLEVQGIQLIRWLGPIAEVSPGGVSPGEIEVVARGHAIVQDRTAAEVAPFVAPNPGERILDLCAAPGGKALHLSELLGAPGDLVAADIRSDRLARLADNARRTGSALRVHDLGSDGEQLPEGLFDRVLVDAPCSNSGVLMKRVDARFRVHGEEVSRLQALQLRILERGLSKLRPGGVLVYSTCSVLELENQRVVRALTARHPRLRLEEERLRLPHRTQRDGGYFARLRLLDDPTAPWTSPT